MRTILVIGAAGLVGGHVARAFDRERVVTTRHRARVPDAVELDVTDRDAVHRVVHEARPDAIVLAAAEPWVDRCEREPDATRAINVEAAAHVSDASRDVGAQLVVLSSEYVFDGSAGPYREPDQVSPINEYGRQKVELERIARDVPRHLVCRTSGVFGWEAGRKNFVCQVLDRLRSRQRMRVPADQAITPTYAPDLALAVAELVRAGATGTFHVVGPRIVRRNEFARAVAATFELPVGLLEEVTSEEMGYAARRPLDAGLRDDRIRTALGHALRAPEAALADMRESEPASTAA